MGLELWTYVTHRSWKLGSEDGQVEGMATTQDEGTDCKMGFEALPELAEDGIVSWRDYHRLG